MTNIGEKYSQFLSTYSKEKKITKKKILEEALEQYIQILKDKQQEQQYAKMAKDTEYLKETQENSKDHLSYL